MSYEMIIKWAILIAIAVILIALAVWGLMMIIIPTFRTKTNRAYYCKKLVKEKKFKNTKAVMTKLNAIVQEAREHCLEKGYDMKISPTYEVEKRNDLGMGIRRWFDTIVYSGVWIEKLLTGAPIWKIAFMESIGHEIGHRKDIKQNILFYLRPKCERKFFYWTREVLNDYRGIAFVNEFYPEHSRKTILNAVKKKAKAYDSSKKKKSYFTHPTWAFRLELQNRYESFSEKVVYAIAKKAGCENKAFVAEIAKLSHV